MTNVIKNLQKYILKLSNLWIKVDEKKRTVIFYVFPFLLALPLTVFGNLLHVLLEKQTKVMVDIAWYAVWVIFVGFISLLFSTIAAERKMFEEQSLHDPLTGLSNRRHFNQEMVKIIARADRHKEEVCMLFIDLDNFGELNKKYGHLVGDIALKHTAKIVSKIIRADDLLTRWAGDEFVVVLATKDSKRIDDLLQRVDEALSNMTIYYSRSGDAGDTMEINFAATTGLAKCSTDGKSAKEITEELTAKADSVMQHGKTHEFPK